MTLTFTMHGPSVGADATMIPPPLDLQPAVPMSYWMQRPLSHVAKRSKTVDLPAPHAIVTDGNGTPMLWRATLVGGDVSVTSAAGTFKKLAVTLD